ncbi:MAG: Nif3-like dinuclear metal center hexameric protein [Actinobacteria bacterium]|nr:Nif3-like dinuclear metal center hexameric protein [Actinomycetota bacterium]MBU1945255.1 Nif3-like dinuclear metal center hexameric protein [Actinomycetota bacterium]MBU2687827.1 Nif3-like dinuclear metal center hexameric protein [Actinomycetota bacterium]
MVTLRRVMEALGEMYPWELAGPTDDGGVLVGSLDSEIAGVLCAVDPVSDAVQASLDGGCELLVVHHPHLLKGSGPLDAGTLGGELVRTSMREGLDIVACHTNADYAEGGLASLYATRLGLEVEGPLVPAGGVCLTKIVVFVPAEALDEVAAAMAGAGAGVIGDYTHCSFQVAGTGTFLPGEGARPYSGSTGELSREAETRLEMIAPSFRVKGIVRAMRSVHPYEEVAFDVYPLDNPVPWGLGRFGALPGPRSPRVIMEELMDWCGSGTGVLEGDEETEVSRVAVVPGMGDDGVVHALTARVELFVTGELSWHHRLELMEAGVAVMMLGHAPSEAPFVSATVEGLSRASKSTGWGLRVEGFEYVERKGA